MRSAAYPFLDPQHEPNTNVVLSASDHRSSLLPNALEEMLAGKPVTITDTRVHGCSTKWKSKQIGAQSRDAEMKSILAEPVTLANADMDALKQIRSNDTGKVEAVVFWSSKCAACQDSFHALETTWRMYRLRAFTLVTVSNCHSPRGCLRPKSHGRLPCFSTGTV